jgi:hypothetical protein
MTMRVHICFAVVELSIRPPWLFDRWCSRPAWSLGPVTVWTVSAN